MPYLFEVTIERFVKDDYEEEIVHQHHHVIAENIQDVANDFLRDYSSDEIIKIERHVPISRNILHHD